MYPSFFFKKKVFFAENCKSQGLLWLLGSCAQSAVDMFTLSYIHSTSTLAYQALKSISSIAWPFNFIWASKNIGKGWTKGRFFSESMMHFSHCPKNVPKTILKKRFWNCVLFRVSWLTALQCPRAGKFKIQS